MKDKQKKVSYVRITLDIPVNTYSKGEAQDLTEEYMYYRGYPNTYKFVDFIMEKKDES